MDGHQNKQDQESRCTELSAISNGIEIDFTGEEWSWVKNVSLPEHHASSAEDVQNRDGTDVDGVQHAPRDGDVIARPADPAVRDISSLVQDITETYSKLTSERDETIQLREQSIFEREEGRHRREFFMKSQDALAGSMAKADSALSLQLEEGIDIEGLQQQLKDDREVVNSQDQRTLQVELELMQKDFKLKETEAAFIKLHNELLAALGERHHILLEQPKVPSRPPATTTCQSEDTRSRSTAVPLPLETYYETMGAVGWKRDRLHELQTEYEEVRLGRSYRRERGDELELSDEEFENDFRNKVLVARQAVDVASAEADEARAICVAMGLDPDTHKKRRGEEGPAISLLPLTPEEEGPQQLVAPPKNAAAEVKSILGDRDQSSTMLTTMTGPLNHDAAPRKKRMPRGQRSRGRIENWMQSHELAAQYPFEEEHFQQYPNPRSFASSRRSINGSFGDLNDWPVVDDDIKDRLPEQLKEHSKSESNIFQRKEVGQQIRPPRSLSRTRLDELRQRKDLQLNHFAIEPKMAKIPVTG